jgi:branched-chain amino acid transport system ATP-binding protein
VLRVENLHAGYGFVRVLHGISLSVEEREVVAVIGANGAGKSTLLKVISGLLRASLGSVVFKGTRVDGMPPELIVRRGIAHIPEGRQVFPYSTVEENLLAGAYTRSDPTGVAEDLAKCYSRFPALFERRDKLARTLSGGEQQMLAISRGLMSRPALLLMDEPSLGLSPIMVDLMFEIVGELHRDGKSILIVEQNATRALSVADRAYVLSTGNLVLEGAARSVLENAEVQRTYLGM